MVHASHNQEPFPDITFGVFSKFIIENFTGDISLVTVLTMLFTLTNNPDILNLHARQQKPTLNRERSQILSGWMKALTRALKDKVGEESDLFSFREDDEVTAKLVTLTKLLKLDPYEKYGYDENGRLSKKLQPVSKVEPALVIATSFMECQTRKCKFRGLLLTSRDRDVSHTTLIEGTTIHENVVVLIGECTSCHTLYHADHEHGRNKVGNAMVPTGDVYLNSAKYLKIGLNMIEFSLVPFSMGFTVFILQLQPLWIFGMRVLSHPSQQQMYLHVVMSGKGLFKNQSDRLQHPWVNLWNIQTELVLRNCQGWHSHIWEHKE